MTLSYLRENFSLHAMKQQKHKSLLDGIVARCRKEIAESGLSGGGLRWKGRKRMKKKDVPSALMRCLQHGSCSLQKEERDRANKQGPPDSAHLLRLPLPTWIKAEGGCRWSYTNTYGLCTHGPGFTIHCLQEKTHGANIGGYFEFPDYRFGAVITAITKGHFLSHVSILKSQKRN